MEKVKEVIAKVTHKEPSSSTTNTHSTGTHADNHTGVHSGTHSTGTHADTHTGAHSGTHSGAHSGTHSGTSSGPSVKERLDPRVDSDHDGSRNAGFAGAQNTNTGYGGQQTSSGLTGSSHQNTTPGPHSSLGDKLDPRVDSDQDGSRNLGAAQYGAGAHNTNSGYEGQHTSSGLTGSSHQNTTPGPHSSWGDKLDPRVDSDQDGSRNFGAAQYGAGAHNTNSGYDGQHTSSGLTGSSHQNTTTGPHSIPLANKLDPRVSDQDGSRNESSYGGQSTNSGYGGQSTNFGHGGQSTNSGYGGQSTDSGYGGQQTSSGLTGNSHGNTSGLTGSHHQDTGSYPLSGNNTREI